MKKLTLFALLAGLSMSTTVLAADKNNDVTGVYHGGTETLELGARPRPRPPMMLRWIFLDAGTRPKPRSPKAAQSTEQSDLEGI